MAMMQRFSFPSSTGIDTVQCIRWIPEKEPFRGVVQLTHGIAEYVERYDAFARFLADSGWLVVGQDHLGHGKTAPGGEKRGVFAHRRGWDRALEDMDRLLEMTKKENPGLPYVLFGHSMGSFLCRSYVIRMGQKIDGCILCGTGNQPGWLILGGRAVAWLVSLVRGRRYKSPLMDKLCFGAFNKPFRPCRTEKDWIAANEAHVDAYVADPDCGFLPSVGMLGDMLGGVWEITRRKNIEKVPKSLPILLFAGQDDPVGDRGKGVLRACAAYKNSTMGDVECFLVPEARHEVLAEEGCEATFSRVLEWLCGHVGRKK